MDYRQASLLEKRPGRHGDAARHLIGLLKAPQTIVLCGSETYRRGKTNLACAAVNMFCISDRIAKFMDTMEFFIAVRSTYGKFAEKTEAKVLSDFCEYDLLVLDEFQVRLDSSFENNQLRFLINKRHANYKSTIMVSNLSAETLQTEYLGAALTERIFERGAVIECDWEQWWKTNGKESA